MGIYIGAGALKGLYLDTDAVKKIYLDADVVFQARATDVLFDNGWVDGVSWAGNLLPRPQYTSVATYSFGYVESEGFMRLTVNSSSSYSNVNHNCHVCTAEAITVPANATSMRVQAKVTSTASPQMYMKFGLLTADCVNSMDDSNGGVLSSLLTPTSTVSEYTLALPSGVAGGQFYAIVNARRTAQASSLRNLDIYKVWFE